MVEIAEREEWYSGVQAETALDIHQQDAYLQHAVQATQFTLINQFMQVLARRMEM